jgi:23S rRNA (cytosine1962-C5)-methyltransferase
MRVVDSKGTCLGWGYFNAKSSLAGRMLSFDETPPEEAIKNHLFQAYALRRTLFDLTKTTAYRLVNGEGDLLPGLVVDIYGDVAVLQIATAGIHKLRATIVGWLKEHMALRCIYEKSVIPSRREEGLRDEEGVLFGTLPDDLIVLENGLRFAVDIVEGQKTGFFLDHREMRQCIRGLSAGKRVLNCFGYTGGFSVYAAAGGAVALDTVDISEGAIAGAKRNMELNGFGAGPHKYLQNDVFAFLREASLDYDIVVLDPPAFAKKKKDIVQACRGYKDINRIALQKVPAGTLVLTSSCSYYVDPTLFQTVVFQAAVEAQRQVKILGRHQLAADHPINLCHPEGEYLKSLLLYVE